MLGENYWAKQAATKPKLFPSNAPLCDAVIRGEVAMGPILMSIVYGKIIRHTGDRAVHFPSTQLFRCDHFSGGGFD